MTERAGPRRLIRRYGHRALFLWLFASIHFSLAITLMLMPHVVVPDLFHTYPPEWARAVIWASGAVVAAVTARLWGGRYQWIGFLALGFAPAQRLVSYGFSVGINAYHLSPVAWTRLSTMFTYVLWIGAIWVSSTVKDEVDLDALEEAVSAPTDKSATA